MPSITDTRLKELVALAERATQGEWQFRHGEYGLRRVMIFCNIEGPNSMIAKMFTGSRNYEADVTYIVAANPATVKAMAKALLEARLLLQESLGFLAYLNSDPQLMPTGKAKINDAMHRIELLLRPESLKASQS